MAKKFYVVWQGRTPGIYTDWNSCKQQVDKFAGAKYKSFPTQAEAEAAFKGTTTTAKASTAKKSTATSKKTSAQPGVKTYTSAEIAKLPIEVKIYTDGGCDPNPGQAGTGMAVYRNDQVAELWYGLYNPMGTNNTAELNGLLQALMLAEQEVKKKRSVAIFCDSKYAIQCVTQWAIGWQKKGWTRPGGEIKNLDLIKAAFALHQTLKEKLQVLHVNGHVGVEGNELADRMSILAIRCKETDFTRYADTIDVAKILEMQSG